MVDVAKRYQDQLVRIKKNVLYSRMYFQENNKRFNDHKKFLFYTALNDDMKATLNEIGQPQIECNLLESYVSRMRGEFSKQEPSIEVCADYDQPVDVNTIQVVENYFRYLEEQARKDGTAYEIYTDLLGGGFSVFKVWTDYANERSFHQDIRYGRVFDPTLTGFDPLARLPHKGDGRYCFELFPKTKEEFTEEYPDVDIKDLAFNRALEGFNWSYVNNQEQILLICDYYEKKKKKTKIVELAQTPAMKRLKIPRVMTMDNYEKLIARWENTGMIEQYPIISKARMTDFTTICRYRLIENKVLEYIETDYNNLPLVFADANSVVIRTTDSGDSKQVTRSYIYNAIGAQKLTNVALQSLGNELENTMQSKMIIAKESIAVEYLGGIIDPQLPAVVVYNAFLDKEGVEPGTVPLPPPQPLARPPIPQEILGTLQLSFTLMQNILGSYDASLGINNNQLSGIAIVEGATQSNASAMPIIIGYMQALNQVAQVVVDLMPKYMITPRTIPVMMKDSKKGYVKINTDDGVDLHYGENVLTVKVEAGLNFSVQKSKTMQQLISLMQASPLFAEFMNTKGLPILLKNIDINGSDELQIAAEQFMQEKQQQMQQQMQAQQQAMQNNPQMLKAQTEMAKVQQQAQQSQVDSQLKASELTINQQKIDNERLQILVDMEDSKRTALVALDKHQTEKSRAAADVAMQAASEAHSQYVELEDMHHKHTHAKDELGHKVLDTVLKHKAHEANELNKSSNK